MAIDRIVSLVSTPGRGATKTQSPPSAAYMPQRIGSVLVKIITWGLLCTNAGLLSIGPLGTNCNEILIKIYNFSFTNKANLRDLIAATSLVFLLKIVNHQFFSLCDLEIWWMTSKNNRAPFLYYFKFFASFQSHLWILTGITVRKCSIRVKIGDFLSRVTLTFEGWHWKTIGHLFHATSSFVHHFKAIGQFKLELQSGNAQFGSKLAIFCPVWPWNLTDDLEKQ